MKKVIKKCTSITLVAIVIVSAFVMLPTSASALSQNDVVGWMNSKIGTTIYDGGNQCVAAFNSYLRLFGFSSPISMYPVSYAYQIFNYDAPDGWQKIAGSGNYQVGDVVIWNSSVGGGAGHVGMVYSTDGGVQIFDQNYVAKSLCGVHSIAQTGAIRGVFRPNLENGHDPTGVLDIASGGEGTVYIRGWAFDEDDRNAQLEIHVYIGGSAGDPHAEGHGGIIANGHRSDVNNVYGCGEYHGFEATISTSRTGNQPIYVYAINVGNGNNRQLGDATVTIIPKGTQSISDGYYHIVSMIDTSKGIDVATGSLDNGANIQLYSNTNDDNQVFKVTYLGNGCYKIINRKSGKGLDCEGANTTSGTNVQQWDYVDEAQHQWIIQDCGDGESFNIISRKSGLYLDVYGGDSVDCTNIQIYNPNNTNAQKWRFIAWGGEAGKSVPEGEYRIVSALDDNMAIDVYGAETTDEANIQLYSNLHSPEQTFSISYIDNGYYKIQNTHSGKSLDLKAAKCISGTSIQQYHYENVPQQQWIIKPVDNDLFSIISKKGGLYVDVAGGKAKNQVNIQGYIGNNSNAQKWKLRRVLKDDMVSVKDVTIKSETDEVSPKITVTVDDNVIAQDGNYEVEITTDLAAGKGTVTVTGIDKYCDSVTKEFNITVESAILGDADGDGEVTSIDATLIQRYDAWMDTGIDEDVLMNGDVDGNGELEIIDATWLQRYLAYMDVPYLIDEPIG